ncbi:MAG: flippase [Anaerocolumna sp.]
MPSKQNSIKRNFIFNSILTLSSIIFPLITFPYVSRILLPGGTGKVSFAISVVFYFNMFAQLGVPTYGIRACAKVRDNKEELTRTVQEILIINLVMNVIVYTSFFIALLFVPRLQEDKMLFIIVSITIMFNTIGAEWLYKALEQYAYITIRSVIFKYIALVGMFFFIHHQRDYVIYGAITIFAGVGSNIFNFINIRKYIYIFPMGNYCFKKHLKAILIFFAMSVATTVYTHLDTVMLGFIKTDADVGYYNAAVKIKGVLVSFVSSLGVVLLPRTSYYIEHGLKNEFNRITGKALYFIVMLASSVSIYFLLFAKEGILFLSGTAYAGSIVPMEIIMPTVFFIGLTNILGIQMLVPLGKEKYVLYSEIAGAAVNLIINIILIPGYASAGAAIGTLSAEIVVFIVQFIVLKEKVVPLFKSMHWLKLGISLIVASILSSFIKLVSCNSEFMVLVVSAFIFFGIYGLMLHVFKEKMLIELEKQVLLKIRNRFRK